MSVDNNQEFKLLQEELSASEARFHNVVDISPDGIVVVDNLGIIRFINDAAERLFDRNREGLLGKEFGFPVVSGEKTEIQVLNAYGKPLNVEMRVVEIVWENQKAFLASLRDVSEHARLISKLNGANQELMHFSYAVSHDIKSPLRNVHTLASMLIEENAQVLNHRATSDLKLIEDNVNRIIRLVDGLLQFTQIGVSEKYSAKIELNDVFNEAVDNINSDIVASRADIKIEKLPCIEANGMQLVSLFQNLLSNSIKYCENEIPKIRVFAKKRQAQWEISIVDNGIGVDEKHWKRIFMPFQRLHNRSKYDGSGIGLASCKKIVDEHNGHIWIESELGKGSTFFVLLPENVSPR